MIYGIGTDIAKVNRFEKWVQNEALLFRFFSEHERYAGEAKQHMNAAAQHYAARFAAKEAFAKALGTGFVGLSLADFWVKKDKSGKPSFAFGNATKHLLTTLAGDCVVHLSLSHEKEYAIAYVIIETGGDNVDHH